MIQPAPDGGYNFFFFQLVPVPKPRMTRRDKWDVRTVVMRYRAYKDELRLQAEQMQVPLANRLVITFHMPCAPSWSNKKAKSLEGEPHQQTPDIDNLLKGYLDALYEQDCAVYEVHAKKIWKEKPGILVQVLG